MGATKPVWYHASRAQSFRVAREKIPAIRSPAREQAVKKTTLILALTICAPAHAQTYKCVDQGGTTHYSDKPLANCKNEIIKTQRGSAPPTSPRAAAKTVQQVQAECARNTHEYSRLATARPDANASDDGRQQRLKALREQIRGCS
jgi:Domain of unknown function (DUF4124)